MANLKTITFVFVVVVYSSAVFGKNIPVNSKEEYRQDGSDCPGGWDDWSVECKTKYCTQEIKNLPEECKELAGYHLAVGIIVLIVVVVLIVLISCIVLCCCCCGLCCFGRR